VKKKDKKTALSVVFALVGLYVILVIALPYVVLPVTTAAWIVSIFDHFITVKNAVTSDTTFLAIVLGALVALYYILIYRPRHMKKNKKEITTTRKFVFVLVALYALLLIVLPYITYTATWFVTIQDHFVAVKDAIKSDIGFLALAAAVLFGGYYFMVYKPKLKK
jgi:cytochrome bd-type quinol oxidase subunit 2